MHCGDSYYVICRWILLVEWTHNELFAFRFVFEIVVFILDVISIVGICCNIDFKAAYFVPYRSKSRECANEFAYMNKRPNERTIN